MYVYVRIDVCIHVSMCMRVYVRKHVHAYICVWIRTRIYVYMYTYMCMCTYVCTGSIGRACCALFNLEVLYTCLFVSLCLFVYDCARVCVCVHICVHWQQQAGVLCSIQFGGRWRRQWTDSPLSRTPPPPHRTSPEPAPAHAGNESNPPKKSQENQAANKSGWKERWRVPHFLYCVIRERLPFNIH